MGERNVIPKRRIAAGFARGAESSRVLAQRRGVEFGNLLDLHCGLLDHAEDVRVSAIDALQEIAKRTPNPIEITPVMLLSDFLFSFTATSRVAADTFQFLVQLDTPEAH